MKRKQSIYNPSIPIPSFDETLADFEKQSSSTFDLRPLGIGTKELKMKEEDRDGNFHIIGTSGHGKSKYLEYHIRKDIDMGNGLCLIDPSDNAATFKAVLEYCAFKNCPAPICYPNWMVRDFLFSILDLNSLGVKYPKLECGLSSL